MRRIVLTVAAVLAVVGPVAGQTVTVEGGGSGIAAAAGPFVASGGGGYAGIDVAVPGATWLMPYLNVNGFSGIGVNGQAGVAFRLARADWIARPVFRVGGVVGEDGAASAGFGVYVGRRAGGLFTADVGSRRGVSFAIVHMGAYYGFGGE